MKFFRFFILLLFLAVFQLSAWDEGADSYDSIRSRAKIAEVPFIVYVRVDWCPWCKKLDAMLEDSDSDQLFNGKLAVKINPDNSPEEKKIAKDLGVTGYPSMYLIFPGGQRTKLAIPLGVEKDITLNAIRKQLAVAFKE